MKEATKRMEEEDKTRISVKTKPHKNVIQRETKPEFKHKEINWLYENGLRIDKEKLKNILKLPYDSLVSDLTLILKDTIYKYEYFKKLADKSEKWQESRMSFPIHAVYLLGELRAEESLDNIIDSFRQSEEFIEFCYGDFMTGIIRLSIPGQVIRMMIIIQKIQSRNPIVQIKELAGMIHVLVEAERNIKNAVLKKKVIMASFTSFVYHLIFDFP